MKSLMLRTRAAFRTPLCAGLFAAFFLALFLPGGTALYGGGQVEGAAETAPAPRQTPESREAQQNAAPEAADTAPQKYALVIGNGAYSGITRLNNPVNDAEDVSAALRGLGFTVDTLTDADRVRMEEAVTRLKNRLNAARGSYGFFYYAGHGVQSGGENYLIPVDANIPAEAYLRDRALPMQALLDELNAAGNALNIVVLDACRDNPYSWKRSGSRGLQVVTNQPADSIIVYATGAGNTAADGTGRNGLFTAHLLNNLKTPGLSVQELFNRTGADVRRASGGSQVPAVYSQFFETAWLGGRPAVAVQPTPAPVQPAPAPPPIPAVQPAPAPPPAPAVRPAPAPQGPVPANMVRIQGGTFLMGSPPSEAGRDDDETQRQVTVSSFYMGKYEVSQAEYRSVMGNNPSEFKGDNLPVENVSWYDAVEYCNRLSLKEGLVPAYTIVKDRSDPNNTNTGDTLRWQVTWNRNADGYRLPTEAEWEYACRAGTTTPFNTGNNISTNTANWNGNSPYSNGSKGVYRGKTVAAGSFAPNAWGLYDMHGNVNEWCWDWHGAYTAGARTDPVGPVTGAYRVGRGGSWIDGAVGLRSAYRDSYAPSNRGNFLGFRLVRGLGGGL